MVWLNIYVSSGCDLPDLVCIGAVHASETGNALRNTTREDGGTVASGCNGFDGVMVQFDTEQSMLGAGDG